MIEGFSIHQGQEAFKAVNAREHAYVSPMATQASAQGAHDRSDASLE
jgi:hypothetical protein